MSRRGWGWLYAVLFSVGVWLLLATCIDRALGQSYLVEVPIPTYDRDKYMPHGKWADFDKDGRTTRDEVLDRDCLCCGEDGLEIIHDGQIVNWCWVDFYTKEVLFIRKDATVDHVVALKDHWYSGGWGRPVGALMKYANFIDDPDYLVVTERSVNASKGYRGPDMFTAPNQEADCDYIMMYLRVKLREGLRISRPQLRASLGRLGECFPINE